MSETDIQRAVRKQIVSLSRAAPAGSAAMPTQSSEEYVSRTPLPPGLTEAIQERLARRDGEYEFHKKFWYALTGKKYRDG